MADQETAVEVIREIVESAGGSTDAETVVPALKDLQTQLGPDGLEQYVYAWLDEHGATVGYSVSNGDLSVTLS